MKRFCICLFVLLCFLNNSFAQLAGPKISNPDKNWQPGGIFYGKTPQQEILSARTECTKKFDRGNGLIDIFFGGPFHYTDKNGALQDINLDIRPLSQSAFNYTNDQNNFISRFADIVARGVQMDYKEKRIAFGLMTKVSSGIWNPAPFVTANTFVKNNTILYQNIYHNIDIGYEVTTEAVKHQMVFKSREVFTGIPSAEKFVTIEEMVQLPENATLSDNDGSVTTNRAIKGNLLVHVNGEIIFTIKEAYIWDASFNGNPDEQSQSAQAIDAFRAVTTSVVLLSPTTIRLIASVPVLWLTSPNRVFPVVLDPTVNVGNTGSFSVGYRYPFNTCRQQRVSQILFRKSDINAGGITTTGSITDIGFYQNTPVPIANNNVQIKMQEVSWNVMTTPTLTSSGFTTVYGPSTESFTSGSNVWRTLNLSSPFTFTNTNNLLIETRFSNSTFTSGCDCNNFAPGGRWGWYNSPYAGHRWAYSMSNATPPSGNTCNYNNSPEGNPAYGYFIPATRITINTTGGCVPVNFTSHPSSQTLVAPAQAQFTVAVTGTTPTYQWEMSTNGGASWGNVPAAAPYSGVTTNQLTINPTSAPLSNNRYRCRVTNSCTPSPVTSNTAVLTINAAGCGTVVTPASSPSIPAAGGAGSFTINVTPNTCSWSASETLTWVTITSPLSGTGDGTLNYTVAANTGGPRSGTISVNGQNHTINQLGAAAPTTYTISGRVIENGSIGIPNAVISTTPVQGPPVLTDAQGYYTLIVPLAYTGTVRATLSPYTFTPLTHPVSSSNFNNKDFDAIGVSMTVTSSVIPPWQREADDYNGSITVNIGSTSTTAWHIEADVYNASNVHMGNVQFSTTTTITSNFSASGSAAIGTPQRTLFDLSKNGYTVKYAAVFNANTTIQASPGAQTIIIEKKWDKKNYLYRNDDNQQNTILIPTKYYNNNSQTVIFTRVSGISFTLTAGIVPLPKQPFNIWGPYPVSPINGYAAIPYSILKDLAPGDFQYTVINGVVPREINYFDLTKYGKIGTGNSNKVVVAIGGIFNEMDETAKYLNGCTGNCSPSCSNADCSFTVVNALKNNGIDIWYIGQGNANSIRRNGYDIANALKSIITDNPQYSEVDLLCHSKGGLDTRAFLQGFNNSYDNSQSLSYTQAGTFNKVKRVGFLGTPHKGARLATLLNGGISASGAGLFLLSPGSVDLIPNSAIIDDLNNNYLPQSIVYLNLAGYKSNIVTNITLPYLTPVSSYHHAKTDGIVQVKSNNSLLTNFPNNTIKQLYQNSPNSIFGAFPHFELHKQSYLSHLDNYHNTWNCLTTTNPTNLDKIVKFFTSNLPFTIGSPFSTCSEPSFNNITIGTYASYASGANLTYYRSSDPIKYYIGKTNEYGNYCGSFSDLFNQGDSLLITSNGHENLFIPINQEISISKKIRAVLINSNTTNKVSYPIFKLTSQSPITTNASEIIFVTGNNVNSYSINVHSSEVNFIPLNLTGNTASIPLDTGLNKIIVRFNGMDTISLSKEIVYLPDTLANQYTQIFSINSPPTFYGAKIFCNDQYLCDVTAPNKSLSLFIGYNELKFTRFGYQDAVYITDTTTTINLSMQPYSYSSLTDSTIFNFNNRPNPQYWKTITVKNMSSISNKQLSAKQFDDPFTGMSLKPQTRKFVFRRMEPQGNAAYYKTAIALDQINTPDKDSVYLLSIKGNRYIKYQPNVTGVTEYDPEVQKVEFDKLDFTSNSTHEIVLMQKQPPVMKPMDTIWHSGQTLVFPIDMFVSDPDSIKNDITASSTDVKVVVNGNLVYVTAPVNFTGITSFTLTGTHDWLDRTQTYTMKVIPPEVFIPTAFTPNNDGLNDILRPTFMGKLLYCHFSVYNRYGQKVFETKDCLAGWNGRIQGLEQPTSTFVYYLTYRFEGTKEEEKTAKGTFTLIK